MIRNIGAKFAGAHYQITNLNGVVMELIVDVEDCPLTLLIVMNVGIY